MQNGQNASIAMAFDCNVIEQVKVASLLDDRYFFIPSYQRGYRWTKQQVYDLCNDLLEYILQPNKTDGSFYSLQPLIVRKGKFVMNGEEKEAFEVIDGQQRLTTIFLLYRFLAKNNRYNNLEQVTKTKGGKKLFHIFYQTREGDYELLEKTVFDDLKKCDIKDIDMAHISNTLYYMNCWLWHTKEEDPECADVICNLFNSDIDKEELCEKLFKLLNDSDKAIGSVQFIWYEIDKRKDAIKEFLKENKGKIQLTDTEKIRALFMQRRSSNKDDAKNLKQLSIAKDWELVENTLHKNDFWSFINNNMSWEDGRINVIFQYIFENDSSSQTISQEGDYLFRFFYSLLAKNTCNESSIENKVDYMWKQVMDCFRMLQNWYYNPKIYNLVGLLVKHGYSINKISDIYNSVNVNTHEDFISALNKEIFNEIINKIVISKGNDELEIPEDEEYINLFYKDKDKIHDLLRFINIREMNKTIERALSEIDKDDEEKKHSDLNRSARDVVSHIYRFPFEALDVFGWDIEHIDSATTNSLTDPKEQEEWLKGAEKTLKDKLWEDNDYKLLNEQLEKCHSDVDKNEILRKKVERVHSIIEEIDSGVQKNWIGNLTLLDSGTNRSYKNKIFAWKKEILQQRVRAGVFVPICTQNIFNKSYPGTTPTDWKWNLDDKKAYNAYILSEIKQFKEELAKKESENNNEEIVQNV